MDITKENQNRTPCIEKAGARILANYMTSLGQIKVLCIVVLSFILIFLKNFKALMVN